MAAIVLVGCTWKGVFAQVSPPDPAQARKRLEESIGRAPWSFEQGYQLQGQFILKSTGEEIHYAAAYIRHGQRWRTTFVNTDNSKSVQCGLDSRAWMTSAETLTEVGPEQLPFCAQYDFPMLHAELLRILEKGRRDPLYGIAAEGNDVYVRGTLWNGLQATFTFNTVDYFPRKAAILAKSDPTPAWLFAVREPSGIATFIRYPNSPSNPFELWFSDPVSADGYRHPRRTDYADGSGVVGTFISQSIQVISKTDAVLSRPSPPAWPERLSFHPKSELHRPTLNLGDGGIASFRSRLAGPPWRLWRQTNALAAAWGIVASWICFIFPTSPSLTTLTITLGVALLGIIFLLRRRRQLAHVSGALLFALLALWLFVFLSGLASMQVRSSLGRSLTALHLAIRYAATGNSLYSWHAHRLLRSLEKEIRSASSINLARACQAGSIAYDLISSTLKRAEQQEIERILFRSAKPIYGAMQGWRANTGAQATFSAAVGLTGLVIGFDPYVTEARQGIEKTLAQQLVGGVHREGPASGCLLLNDLLNLLYAMKCAGAEDHFKSPALLEYINTTIQLLSPAGTLPLFSETGLEHSIPAVQLLLKASNHVPEDLGRRCVAAHDRYWTCGHFAPSGWRGMVHGLLDRHTAFYTNPYVFLLYQRSLPAALLPAESSILGGGQVAVLRSAGDPSSAYLALNARKAAANLESRDILSFDLYSGGSLLLHGAGFPGRQNVSFAASIQTAASNSITFNETSQSGLQSSGVAAALLNQPIFEYVRILADRAYESGQVQREVILTRQESNLSPYFLLIDEIHTNDPATRVQWYLHGRGKLATGMNLLSRWTCTPVHAPGLPSSNILMTAYPIGVIAGRRSAPGKIFTQNRLLEQASETLIMEWEGPRRFCTVLFPLRAGQAEPPIESVSDADSGKIGDTDWVSLSDPGTRRTTGPFRHISECAVVRTRGERLPALLMISGTEFQIGKHSLFSSKPVTVSLDGLQGGMLNFRPETRVEWHSPEIHAGERFLLDDTPISSDADGVLSFLLAQTGEHRLRRLP